MGPRIENCSWRYDFRSLERESGISWSYGHGADFFFHRLWQLA